MTVTREAVGKVRVVLRDPVAEKTTALITAVIKDELDQPIAGTALTTLTLTLYARDVNKTIINSRNEQNVLGANGGAVDASGNLSQLLGPNDGIIVDDTAEVEEHILLFEWSYASGSKSGKQEALLKVVNLEKVPESPP